jgi:ABC-2 type transport system ATP-binding protein
MAAIYVKELTKSFSYHKKEIGFRNSLKNLFQREMLSKEAVKKVSFEIDEGEIVGFLGPNGAGKTTTLKMLSGILYPTAGEASVLGFTPWERKKEFKKLFSIVMGQKNQLWWDLPANESLYLNKAIYEVDDREYYRTLSELAELLDVVELLKVQVRRLSLGERMKIELIAALIHKPKVLFLDEPTIGLDILSQRKIREFLKYFNQQNKTTIILTSHYMDDVEDMCKRTIVINHGKVVYDGALDQVNAIIGQKKVIKLQLTEVVDQNLLQQFGHVKSYDGIYAHIEVDKEHFKAHAKAIMEQLPVHDITIEDVSIEEGITKLYEKESDALEV